MGEVYASSSHPDFSAARAPAQPAPKRLTKAVVGVTLGNMVEWFDFALYSSLAGIIGKTFFHDDNPTTQLLAIYATFAAGELAGNMKQQGQIWMLWPKGAALPKVPDAPTGS